MDTAPSTAAKKSDQGVARNIVLPRNCSTSQHAMTPSGTPMSARAHTLNLLEPYLFTAQWQSAHAATPKAARTAIIHSAIVSGRRSVRITF